MRRSSVCSSSGSSPRSPRTEFSDSRISPRRFARAFQRRRVDGGYGVQLRADRDVMRGGLRHAHAHVGQVETGQPLVQQVPGGSPLCRGARNGWLSPAYWPPFLRFGPAGHVLAQHVSPVAGPVKKFVDSNIGSCPNVPRVTTVPAHKVALVNKDTQTTRTIPPFSPCAACQTCQSIDVFGRLGQRAGIGSG